MKKSAVREIIINEVKSLRKEMEHAKIDACIIPISDPHLSEYQPERWKNLTWLTGFSGSAGTVVVTASKAGLWVDSRYFLQADNEMANTEIIVQKTGVEGTLSIAEWLKAELPDKSLIGLDGNLFSVSQIKTLKDSLCTSELTINTYFNPFPEIRKDLPPLPPNPIFVYPEKYAGQTVSAKIAAIRNALQKQYADAVLLTALDEIAWTFNLRGSDVSFNPVFIAFAFISMDECIMFIPENKLTDNVKEYLHERNIQLRGYDEINCFLGKLKNINLLIDKDKVNALLAESVSPHCRKIVAPSPVALLKSVKNETEVQGAKNAMIKDGIALVCFYKWLEEAIHTMPLTELDLLRKLLFFKKQQALYVSESFSAIVGFKEHGAIVHYRPDEESNAAISAESFLLIDTGTQYLDGTTDITRTIALGELTGRQKKDFTLVLKGHIAIATCIFPHGTRGAQIDILARKALWDNGLNYLHGTGHGVGHFLNVHEGPQNIRTEANASPLLPYMLLSNEPGLYRTGEYGIRCENVVAVKEYAETEFGKFYTFETLTLFPFDVSAIDKKLLTTEEINWLNNYHRNVFEKLGPHLSPDEREWLRGKTAPIR